MLAVMLLIEIALCWAIFILFRRTVMTSQATSRFSN